MKKYQTNNFIKKIAIVISVAVFSSLIMFFYGKQESASTKNGKEIKGLEYICSMHPNYISKTMGDCPICGMDLVEKIVTQMPGVKLSKRQADEITLTKAKVSMEKIEKWIRTAGSKDHNTKQINGTVYGKDAQFIRLGQQVRVFPLVGREPVLQGKITDLLPGKSENDTTIVQTNISDPWYQKADYYIMEIIVDLGTYPSIPNEAIIEENSVSVVYVMGDNDNEYLPVNISTGIRGELYTRIIDGIDLGDEVVTFGSFFLDAQYKLQKQ